MDESISSVMNGTGTCTSMSNDPPDDDTFRILIATDNHLGFSDMNPARENDSFVTFEEILELAKTLNVDFLLLGGDLFHENKPKPATFQRTIDLLQRYVLGDKPVQFEYLGDPAVDFRTTSKEPEVNYMNPNMNIGLPIFTIHGNHDDPIGGHRTSVIDHLAAANLVNHFGQWSALEGFEVTPVCLRKGETLLALYGLGHMKDERLFRLMRNDKVTFLRPDEDRENWFGMFVLHQNRVKHGPKNYFPESALPPFLDFIVWGHEHECMQKEEENPYTGDEGHTQFILQPGSSVATSLCDGEAREKNVFLLEINRRQFRCSTQKLKTVRPFIWHTLRMSDILEEYKGKDAKKRTKMSEASKYVESFVTTQINTMIEEATRQLTGHERQPTQPLIRLRVEYDNEEEQFNTLRIAQQFKETVANDDIIVFKKSGRGVKTEDDAAEMSIGAIRQMINQLDDQSLTDLGAHVEEIVEQHFTKEQEKPDGQILEVLSDKGLSEAIRSCVDKDDKESIGLIVDAQIQATIDWLMKKKITPDNIDDEIKEFRSLRSAGGDVEQARSVLAGRKNRRKGDRSLLADDDSSSDEEPQIEDDDDDPNGNSSDAGPVPAPARGRARGRGRGAGAAAASTSSSGGGRGRGGRGRGQGSGANAKAGTSKSAAVTLAPGGVQQRLPFRAVTASTNGGGGARGANSSSAVQFDDDSD